MPWREACTWLLTSGAACELASRANDSMVMSLCASSGAASKYSPIVAFSRSDLVTSTASEHIHTFLCETLRNGTPQHIAKRNVLQTIDSSNKTARSYSILIPSYYCP